MREIFILHEIQKIVIIDRDAKFTSNFLKSLFTWMDTQLNFSRVYHPQLTDGKNECVDHVLEDMLRMYVMYQPSKWMDSIST